LFVVGAIEVHEPLQSGRAQHEDVVETLASGESDEPFDAWGLRAIIGSRDCAKGLVRPEGLEPPAYRFEACRSIQLSYGRK
jgi:hypothetical protein